MYLRIYTVIIMLSGILDNLMSKLYQLYSKQHVKRSHSYSQLVMP